MTSNIYGIRRMTNHINRLEKIDYDCLYNTVKNRLIASYGSDGAFLYQDVHHELSEILIDKYHKGLIMPEVIRIFCDIGVFDITCLRNTFYVSFKI